MIQSAEVAVYSHATPYGPCPPPAISQPLSTAVARPPTPSLEDRIRNVLMHGRAEANARHRHNLFAAQHLFHNVSKAVFQDVVCALDESCPGARIDYLAPRSLLTITFPGLPHELLATNIPIHLRSTLHAQGFYPARYGTDIEGIQLTGSADNPLNSPRNGTAQPDGALKLRGVKHPFLMLEVADSQLYAHAVRKAKRLLLDTHGAVRFVLVVNMVRKKPLGKRNTGVGEAGVKSARTADEAEEQLDTPADPEPKLKPDPDPAAPPTIRSLYTHITLTVLTSTLHPTTTTTTTTLTRTPLTLIPETPFWPELPPPNAPPFSFTWAAMGVRRVPPEVEGRTFTVGWGPLWRLVEGLLTEEENADLEVNEEEGGRVVRGGSEEEEEEEEEEENDEDEDEDDGDDDGEWVN